MNEELRKLKEMIAISQKKLQTMQADMGEKEDDKMGNMMREMYSYMDYVLGYIYKLEDNTYRMMSEHRVGHLPQIKGAGKMQSILESLGLDDDYEVYKPMISVANTQRGKIIEAIYNKKK